MMKRTRLQKFGLLGIINFLSYMVALIFAPLAYPNYDWRSQAVSDLSAVNAPSRMLCDQLSAFYPFCGLVCVTLVCIYIKDRFTKAFRTGIYLFTIMTWISAVGYRMFPLVDPNQLGSFQDLMHLVVTALVVGLSIISLTILIIAGFHKGTYPSLAIWAAITLAMMFIGAIGTGVVPRQYFGIVERFSVTAATAFPTILGIYLYNGFNYQKNS